MARSLYNLQGFESKQLFFAIKSIESRSCKFQEKSMIKRIVNSRLPLIVYNPPKVFDMDYFKETYNAGGLPVLDTEFFEYDEIVEIIER